jgi:TamB, inner membrane protein subunit of TAM complex
MTDDPRPPVPPTGPPSGRESLPDRVAESVESEVREMHDKIEEVVEHALPKRGRLSAGRIAWIILGSLFALALLVVGGAVFYFTRHSEWLAGELTTLINRSLAEHSNVVLQVRDLSGNPFKSVRLIEPRMRFRDDPGPALLEMPSMTVSYAPWDLWFGRRRSIRVLLDHPMARITRGADGRLRIPEWRSGPKGPGLSRELEVALTMQNGTVRMPDSSDDIVDWNVSGNAIVGRNTQVSVQSMRWRSGPYASVLQNLTADYTAADSVRFHILELRTPDLVLRANGGWLAEKTQRQMHVEIDRVRWGWLAKAFDNDAFDVTGSGSAVIDARYDRSWRGTARVSAMWDSLQGEGNGSFVYDRGRLTVEPVSLLSPAGNLTGGVVYDKEHVDVHGLVTHGDPERWDPIGLHGWPKGDLQGRMSYVLRHTGREGSHLDAQLSNSELAGWKADTAWVMVEAPKAASDTFAVTMLRRGGRVTLGGRIDENGWHGPWTAVRYPLEEWPDGRASGIQGMLTAGSGTVDGRKDGLHVTGTLAGTRSEWLGMTMESWRLDDVAGLLLPKPDLAASARLTDLMFVGIHFDSAAAGLHLGDNQAALERVDAVAGDTTVSVAGHASWRTGAWHVDLDRAEMQSGQFHWIGEPPVALSGDAEGVVFDRFSARDSLARVALSGRWAAPGGFYDWSGRATDLDLGRLGLPLDLGLSGRGNGVLRITGRSGDPHWTFEGSASRPGMSGHEADSLILALEGAPSRLEVKQFTALLDGGALQGHLAFDHMRRAWPDTLTAPGVESWLTTAGSWQGTVRGDSLPLDRLQHVAAVARGWSGRVSGHVDIGGHPEQPELTAQVDAAPLGWETLRAEHVVANARYRDERLEIEGVRITRGNILSTASGTLPVRLAMGAKPELLDRPMTGRLDLENGDLALVPIVMPQIGQANGRVDLHASVRGTPFDPVLDGRAHISGGEARMAGREEVVDHIEADFHFDQARAWMDHLTARQGRKGTIGGRGWVNLADLAAKKDIRYTFKLLLRNFTALETGLYVAEFESIDSLSVTQTPGVTDRILPFVSGALTVRQAVVLFDFANQTETQKVAATTAPLVWTYELHVLALNNLKWQPPDGDIEFSADLNLKQSEKDLKIFGDLHALRGTYDFLSNRFTVRKADLNFDNVGGVNPVIDAEATTRIIPIVTSTASSGPTPTLAADQLPHVVTVDITGRSDHPTIEFRSDPADWDQPTILSQLTVGRFVESSGQVTLKDPLDNWLTKKINEQLAPLISQTFLKDVGHWQLERQQGGLFYGRGDVYLTINRTITPRLSLTVREALRGWQGKDVALGGNQSLLTNSFDRNIEAEYRLNRFFYVTTELAQRRLIGATPNATTTPDFNVNLKARWEY